MMTAFIESIGINTAVIGAVGIYLLRGWEQPLALLNEANDSARD